MPSDLTQYINQQNQQINNPGFTQLIGKTVFSIAAWGISEQAIERLEVLPIKQQANGYKSLNGFDKFLLRRIYGTKDFSKQFKRNKQFQDFLKTNYPKIFKDKFDPNLFALNQNKDYYIQRKQMGQQLSEKTITESISGRQLWVNKIQRGYNQFTQVQFAEMAFEIGQVIGEQLVINPLVERGKEVQEQRRKQMLKEQGFMKINSEYLVESQQTQMYKEVQLQQINDSYNKTIQQTQISNIQNPYIMYRVQY